MPDGYSLGYMESGKNWRAMTFGTRVKELRELRKMSQTQLGSAIGITQPSVSAIESGASRIEDIKAGTIFGMLRKFEVNYSFLVNGIGSPDDKSDAPPSNLSAREELLVEYIAKLTPEQQEELLKPVRAAVEANDVAQRQLKGGLKTISNTRMEDVFGLPKKEVAKEKKKPGRRQPDPKDY